MTSENCGSKTDDGTIIGPDCFWNDEEQECQRLDALTCSYFLENKDECIKFEKCFFNEQRNLCENNCSKFLHAKSCSEANFCHFERKADEYYGRTCTQAICNDFGTEGECNGQSHCIYDEFNSKCTYKCEHISFSTCADVDHCRQDFYYDENNGGTCIESYYYPIENAK